MSTNWLWLRETPQPASLTCVAAGPRMHTRRMVHRKVETTGESKTPSLPGITCLVPRARTQRVCLLMVLADIKSTRTTRRLIIPAMFTRRMILSARFVIRLTGHQLDSSGLIRFTGTSSRGSVMTRRLRRGISSNGPSAVLQMIVMILGWLISGSPTTTPEPGWVVSANRKQGTRARILVLLSAEGYDHFVHTDYR